jgi:hypothetical protein
MFIIGLFSANRTEYSSHNSTVNTFTCSCHPAPAFKSNSALTLLTMNNPSESPNHNTNRPHDKTVRFAPTSHMLTFKAIGTENTTKSYNQDDYERFLFERHRDIVTCSELVARTWSSGELLSTEEICLCTGLEAYLAPNVARRVRKLRLERKIHVTHVLVAQTQARHFQIDNCSEDIARVSIKLSRAAVARAVKVATGSC